MINNYIIEREQVEITPKRPNTMHTNQRLISDIRKLFDLDPYLKQMQKSRANISNNSENQKFFGLKSDN